MKDLETRLQSRNRVSIPGSVMSRLAIALLAPFLLAACVWLLAARDAAAGSRTVRVRAGMPSDHAALLAS